MNREFLGLCCAHVGRTIDRLSQKPTAKEPRREKQRERKLKEYQRLQEYMGAILLDATPPVGQMQ